MCIEIDVSKCIRDDDVEQFLAGLETAWRKSNKKFKQVQAEVVRSVKAEQVPPIKFMTFVGSCVKHLILAADKQRVGDGAGPAQSEEQLLPDKWEDPPQTENRENPWKPTNAPLTGTEAALCHLLLEMVPPPLSLPSDVATPDVQQAAAELFNTCLERRNARLAVKVAGCYALQLLDHGEQGVAIDRKLLTESVQDMLENRHLVGPAVGLLMHFPGLSVRFDRMDIMLALISDGQAAMAAKWAAELGSETQEQLVEACIEGGNLRDACKFVGNWSLQSKFPNLKAQYQQRTMEKLLGKSLWGAAAGFAIGNTEFQRQLVTALAIQGEHALAEAYSLQFGLDTEGLPLHGAALAESRKARDATFHQLRLPLDRVQFVDTVESLERAQEHLLEARVVGIDVEWRPDLLGQKSPASIIQVASTAQVFIFDLVALHDQPELDAFLRRLFQDGSIIKLSMDGSQDLKKLAGSYPDLTAFQEVRAVLNVIHLWAIFDKDEQQMGLSRKRQQIGLSTIVERILGKPLDKSMQMSDWSQRPLSDRQMRYAALDAFVMVELWNFVGMELGQQVEAELKTLLIDICRPKRKSRGSGTDETALVKPQATSNGVG